LREKLSVLGEFQFIEAIRRAFAGVGEGGIVGIGDDCAVLPTGGDEALVVTTDMLVEGVHFLRHATSARELGAKSLAVNLSDIAAMGARPVASLLSIALPAECRGERAQEFMEGYREMSLLHGVALVGGDTTASRAGIAINVVAIGRAAPERLKYRSGARVGDIVVVNGVLGESAAGLRDILAGRLDTPHAHIHRNPTPQVSEGEWLGGRAEVHSMLDLSDGLASDLGHILRASGVGASVELGAIPTPVSIEDAVTGGEDYKLLFTVAPESFASIAADYLARFGEPLYPVGRITDAPPEIVWLEYGQPVEKDWHGFVHF
jgi:thiamine-monophosphate kinase